ncbi:hypothetical protein NCCP2495_05530 [Dietzia sp. NCCP-2495]|nr:hypothetical protein NCCP2495_05530 [Dietzia sp. NCCP-2495]
MVDEFGPGGTELHGALSRPDDEYSTTSLVVEAARIKDRLDRLHALTSGDADSWCRVFRSDFDGELVLKLDTAVSEQRQLTTVFRQLLAEIERRQGDDGGAGDGGDDLAGL